MKFKLWVLLTIVLCSSYALADFQSESWIVPSGLPEYRVIRVIDGDTIVVRGLGKVRYIGIDTPELRHPTKGEERFGFEASEYNKKLLQGKPVKLEFDIQRRDKYHRILAYVYAGSTFVNACLVEAGYAEVMTIPPNVKYQDLFLDLQRRAKQGKKGLWGLDTAYSETVTGFPVKSFTRLLIHRLETNRFKQSAILKTSCKVIKANTPSIG